MSYGQPIVYGNQRKIKWLSSFNLIFQHRSCMDYYIYFHFKSRLAQDFRSSAEEMEKQRRSCISVTATNNVPTHALSIKISIILTDFVFLDVKTKMSKLFPVKSFSINTPCF